MSDATADFHVALMRRLKPTQLATLRALGHLPSDKDDETIGDGEREQTPSALPAWLAALHAPRDEPETPAA